MFAISLLSYVVRGVRIHEYFPGLLRGRLAAAVRLSALHDVACNLLPMRSGEAAFPLHLFLPGVTLPLWPLALLLPGRGRRSAEQPGPEGV